MTDAPTPRDPRRHAREILERAWSPDHDCCRPNPDTYPHQWLWDSAFHAVGWAVQGDERWQLELDQVATTPFASGFLPHMTYHGETIRRGPRRDVSSLTQPHVFGCVVELIEATGATVPDTTLRRLADGVGAQYLLRRTADALVTTLHPWEAGWDDSPRWDSWVGHSNWNRDEWTAFDLAMVESLEFAPDGEAVRNRQFTVASVGMNAILADAAITLGDRLGDAVLSGLGRATAEAIDGLLWNTREKTWDDLPMMGGGSSCTIPTLDGLLPLLVTTDDDKIAHGLRTLEQRFLAPYGVAFVARDLPGYDPGEYWRGSAWTPMELLVLRAVRRHGRDDLAERIAEAAVRGAISSGFSEHRNPEDGTARGASPQTWTTAALAVAPPDAD